MKKEIQEISDKYKCLDDNFLNKFNVLDSVQKTSIDSYSIYCLIKDILMPLNINERFSINVSNYLGIIKSSNIFDNVNNDMVEDYRKVFDYILSNEECILFTKNSDNYVSVKRDVYISHYDRLSKFNAISVRIHDNKPFVVMDYWLNVSDDTRLLYSIDILPYKVLIDQIPEIYDLIDKNIEMWRRKRRFYDELKVKVNERVGKWIRLNDM